MRVVVSVGGGISSTLLTPLKAVELYGAANVDLIMARLPNEHPDTWRLIGAAEHLTGRKVAFIGTGEHPFDVFMRIGMMGNTLADPCSRILKREQIALYMREHYDPADTIICVGITAHEATRVDRRIAIRENWTRQGWQVAFPLEDDETLTKERQLELCQQLAGFVPELYENGFEHNNCGGACVKAGKEQWAKLLYHYPDVYTDWERREQEFQIKYNTDATILRDERKDGTKPVSLATIRKRCIKHWSKMLAGFQSQVGYYPRGANEVVDNPPCHWCAAM